MNIQHGNHSHKRTELLVIFQPAGDRIKPVQVTYHQYRFIRCSTITQGKGQMVIFGGKIPSATQIIGSPHSNIFKEKVVPE